VAQERCIRADVLVLERLSGRCAKRTLRTVKGKNAFTKVHHDGGRGLIETDYEVPATTLTQCQNCIPRRYRSASYGLWAVACLGDLLREPLRSFRSHRASHSEALPLRGTSSAVLSFISSPLRGSC
jgi:hypothetical protein